MGEVGKENLDLNTHHISILNHKDLIPKILEITSDTLIILDAENRCVDLMLKTENPVLNPNRQIVGYDFLEVLGIEDTLTIKRELDFVRNTGISSNVNYDLPTEEKMYYFKLIVHRFDEKHLICQYRDITQRSNMKGRLKSTLFALMEVGKVAKISHWSYDPLLEIISFPDYSSQEDIFALETQDVSLSDYLKDIHEDDRVVVTHFMREQTTKTITVEYRLTRSGSPVEYFRSTRYGQLEGQNAVSGFTQNVTDFMKNRSELEMIVSIVQSSPQSAIAAKANGEVIFINKIGRSFSGLTEDHDLTDVNIMMLVNELSTIDKWAAFKDRLKTSRNEVRFRVKNPYPDLDILEMECVASIIKNWQGEDIIWFFQEDVSDQARYQEQLLRAKEAAEESENLKMAFISNMNHEIRTPLSAILGLSMLIADTDEYELRQQYTKLITSNSDHLLRLITDVLEMSKLDAGNMSLIPRLESLHAIMQELKLSFSYAEGYAKLTVNFPQEDTVAYFDKGRIMQLLTNLINNSRKFTPIDGEIILSYEIINDKIAFSVRDNGAGIPKDKQKDVFKRFFKAHDGDQGSGLGLAICKSIVDQMEGEIEMESEEGKGSIFRISLPLIVEQKG